MMHMCLMTLSLLVRYFIMKLCLVPLPHFYFYKDTPPTKIYPLPLHAALPILGNGNGLNANYAGGMGEGWSDFSSMILTVREDDTGTASNSNWNGTYALATYAVSGVPFNGSADRKSTRLNSSHSPISYAVFCLQ